MMGHPVDPKEVTSVVEGYLKRAQKEPDTAIFKVNLTQDYTYADVARLIRKVGKAFIKLGFDTQDKVTLLSSTRLEWVLFALGANAAGGISAGIYHTCSPKEINYIINHSECKWIMVESVALYHKVKAEQNVTGCPHLKNIICLEKVPEDDPMVIHWDDFVALGNDLPDEAVDERVSKLKPEDCFSLVYTSGTTGPPKAVMLSNRGAITMMESSIKRFNGEWVAEGSYISYLPLSHVAEHNFTVSATPFINLTNYFCETMEKLPAYMKEIQPTSFFGPPRLWQKFYAALSPHVPKGVSAKQLPEEVKKKMLTAVGLGRCKYALTGAAPISLEVHTFFEDMGLPLYEIYGQTEDHGPATMTDNTGRRRLGSVGIVMDGMELKIAEDGEILVKGPFVMLGYYKDPKATAETLIDGWLYTGDLGRLDDDGFLYITGRKKDIIITAGGKNISPANIESAIKNHPMISDCVVVGEKRPYLIALIALDADIMAKVPDAITSTEIRQAVDNHIKEINKDLAQVETIKRFAILPPFSQDKGEMTPTLKVKRANVTKAYAELIDSIYSAPMEGRGE